jgi:gas vesicle protein
MSSLETKHAKLRLERIEDKIEELLVELKTYEDKLSECIASLLSSVEEIANVFDEGVDDSLDSILEDCEENIERINEEIGELREESKHLNIEYFGGRGW